MLHIYLCEDEESQLLHFKNVLEQYIAKRHIDAKIVSARRDPEQILEDVKVYAGKQAVFFIDIELKGCSMNGFGLAKELRRQNEEGALVYLTSHEELAYKVFEYELGVLDYIVKNPRYYLEDVISDRLMARLDRIFEEIEKMPDKREEQTLDFECGSRVVRVAVPDIIFVQAVKGKHMAEIYTACRTVSIRQPLKSIYERLNGDFIYVNKSCIVQKSMIREIDRKNRIAVLKGGWKIEIAYRELKNVCSSL